ncbi:hypothetical protein PIB30_051301 [Stylosanthes scabra]|uniref:Uncharacterized protein n=1 Tax=Stylosanthes scabra TaxID=79078 RepID=A0ABU6ZGP7_9FABA|nr:hypothetical protein [Stylosanthes scabra]
MDHITAQYHRHTLLFDPHHNASLSHISSPSSMMPRQSSPTSPTCEKSSAVRKLRGGALRGSVCSDKEEHFSFHKNLPCSSDLQGTAGVDLQGHSDAQVR